MAAAIEGIENLLRGGEPPKDALSVMGAEGQGFAAVDSARGRLYHSLHLDAAGRIADYRIVAPTEWNFHPDGPFARALRGARTGAGARGETADRTTGLRFRPLHSRRRRNVGRNRCMKWP